MKYKNGDEYEGDWKDDIRHGQGKYRFALSGNEYDGEWKGGKK